MPRAFSVRRRVRSILGLALEFVLIAAAVFLGLLADGWREGRQQQQLAERTLERFRVEVAENRAAVESVLEYHVDLRDRVAAFIGTDGPNSTAAFLIRVK